MAVSIQKRHIIVAGTIDGGVVILNLLHYRETISTINKYNKLRFPILKHSYSSDGLYCDINTPSHQDSIIGVVILEESSNSDSIPFVSIDTSGFIQYWTFLEDGDPESYDSKSVKIIKGTHYHIRYVVQNVSALFFLSSFFHHSVFCFFFSV